MPEEVDGRLRISVIRLPHFEGLPLPEYITPGAVGVDLFAAIHDQLHLLPGDIVLVPTGLCVAIPEGYELQIRPRSGLAVKHGITVVNAPGTIDSDYRGEIKVGLINLGKGEFVIERGMRIAQAILARVFRIEWQSCQSLPESSRGDGGFGHTGL